MGQASDVHYQHHAMMPPGAIGSWQLLRGGPLPGWFQPVEIKAPNGALISLAEAGTFTEPKRPPLCVGLLVGQVYRLKVMNIPLHEGQEVFPTIELIDRTYAPPGQELRFPIPIDLSYEDLQLALAGKFVTRVVYIEDPRRALPVAEHKGGRRWFEVAPGQDPLAAADLLGRPVAIIRLGGRAPDRAAPDAKFLFGCPPVQYYAASPQSAVQNSGSMRGGNSPGQPQPTPAQKPPKRDSNQGQHGDLPPATLKPEQQKPEQQNNHDGSHRPASAPGPAKSTAPGPAKSTSPAPAGAKKPGPAGATVPEPAGADEPDSRPSALGSAVAGRNSPSGSTDAARSQPAVRVLPPPPGRKAMPASHNQELP